MKNFGIELSPQLFQRNCGLTADALCTIHRPTMGVALYRSGVVQAPISRVAKLCYVLYGVNCFLQPPGVTREFPQESQISKTPKPEKNKETGTKRRLRSLDAFSGLLKSKVDNLYRGSNDQDRCRTATTLCSKKRKPRNF